MRKTLGAALIGLTVTGGMVIAGTAAAQPYGYYYPQPPGYYDNGYYRPAPTPYYNGYYNGYSNGYYGDDSATGLAGALIGSLLGQGYAAPAVPVDRYGPDPNGMIAPDGHRIKCKLRTGYDGRWGGYRTYRQCW